MPMKKMQNEPNHGAGNLVIAETEWQTNPANSSAGGARSTPVPSPMFVRYPALFAASQARIPTVGRPERRARPR